MVALGHSLGLTVTAEDVETEEQFELLKLAGCDEFQGNLLSPPVAPSAIVPLLGQRTASEAVRA